MALGTAAKVNPGRKILSPGPTSQQMSAISMALVQEATVHPGGVLEAAAGRVVRAEADAGRRLDELADPAG